MLTWIMGLLPWIAGAVRWAETFFGAGKGQEKLAAVLAILDATFPDSSDPAARAAIMEGAKQVVNGIVAIYNATGVFKK